MRRFFFVVAAIVWVAGCGDKPEEKAKSPASPSRKHQDSLITTITVGNVDEAKKHLAEGAAPNMGAPLQVAIESRSSSRKEMDALLLVQSSDVNMPNGHGWTPAESLKRVADNSTADEQAANREIAHLLLKHEANTNPDFLKRFDAPTGYLPKKDSGLYSHRTYSNVLFEKGNSHADISQDAVLRLLLRRQEPVHFKGEQPKRVLFVGNSYTHALRTVMPALLKAQGHKTTIEFVTPGGAQLIKHLNTPKTVNLIKNGKWDMVVFQEQSQTPACPGHLRKLFMKGAGGLHELTKENGSKMVFFNTWGYLNGDKRNFADDTYCQMQKRLNEGYGSAAKKLEAQLAPVGNAYTELKKTNPRLWVQLYQGDGSHPSRTGAYLAAIVIYGRLYGVSPQKIRFNGGLNESVATQLKASAARALKETTPTN